MRPLPLLLSLLLLTPNAQGCSWLARLLSSPPSEEEKAQEILLLKRLTKEEMPELEIKNRIYTARESLNRGGSRAETEQLKHQIRTLENTLLWRERGLRDVRKSGVSLRALQWMVDREAPLGTTPPQWKQMTEELSTVLDRDELADAVVITRGSATDFYATNSWKVLGHYYGATKLITGFNHDVGPKVNKVSGVDFHIYSDQLMDRLQVVVGNPPLAVPKWIYAKCPHLSAYTSRWETILRRPVTFVGHAASELPAVDRNSDWIVHPFDLSNNRNAMGRVVSTIQISEPSEGIRQ